MNKALHGTGTDEILGLANDPRITKIPAPGVSWADIRAAIKVLRLRGVERIAGLISPTEEDIFSTRPREAGYDTMMIERISLAGIPFRVSNAVEAGTVSLPTGNTRPQVGANHHCS